MSMYVRVALGKDIHKSRIMNTFAPATSSSVSELTKPRGGLPYIKVGVTARLAGTRITIIPGCVCISMKAEMTDFDTVDSCPDCGESTRVVKLGSEPTREVCGRFGCSWDGLTLEGPARDTNDSGAVVIE